MRPARPIFQFSIRGLMSVTFGVAASLAIWRQAQERSAVWLAVLAVWFAFGAYNQAYDLWLVRQALPREARWNLCWLLGWRVVVVLLLLIPVLAGAMPPVPAGEEVVPDWDIRPTGIVLVEGCLLFLIALSLLGDPGSLPTAKSEPRESRGICGLAWVCAVALAVVVGADWLCVPALLHAAINGILNYLPYRTGVTWNPAIIGNADIERFAGWSLLAACLVPINVWLVFRLAGVDPRRRLRVLGWLVLLVGTLVLTAVYPIWLHGGELRRLSPILAEHVCSSPARHWLYAAILILASVTTATWQVVRRGTGIWQRLPDDWRRHAGSYYHQHAWLHFLLVLNIYSWIRGVVIDAVTPPTSWWTLVDIASAFKQPLGLLRFALLIAIAGLTIRRWRREEEPRQIEVATVSVGRFVVVWWALLATIVTGIPTLTGFFFAFWLTL